MYQQVNTEHNRYSDRFSPSISSELARLMRGGKKGGQVLDLAALP